jgi:phosphoglycerate dehydrogenase-like enzyme
VLATPLTQETATLLDRRDEPGAACVNISRLSCADCVASADALESGAVIDVYDQEPLPRMRGSGAFGRRSRPAIADITVYFS